MGMAIGFSSSTHDPKPVGNPNPHNFICERELSYGDYAAIMLRYPGCTNYEGRKVMVVTADYIRAMNALGVADPHFCERKDLSPIARFEPTPRGWTLAIALCQQLSVNERPVSYHTTNDQTGYTL